MDTEGDAVVRMGEFEQAYFIQTRQEIDTEKRERDRILNFAVLVLGAIGFAIAQSKHAQDFLEQAKAFMIEIPALVIISSLFWVRHKKLQQISDRWFVLHRLLTRWLPKRDADEMLESVVVKSLPQWRYTAKDFVLNIALCSPLYALLVLQLFKGVSSGQSWRVAIAFCVVVSHLALSCAILARRLSDPLPPLSPDGPTRPA